MHIVKRRAGFAPILLSLAALGFAAAPTAHAQGYTFQPIDVPGTLYYFPPFDGFPGFGPGSYGTYPRGINDSSTVVGYNGDQYDNVISFLYNGAIYTKPPVFAARGINNAGEIVGIDGYSLNGTSVIPLNVPGSEDTQALGINNKGQIVGGYENAGSASGFLFNGTSFQTIAVPGAKFTIANDINDSGVVSGIYNTGSLGRYHGFLYDGTTFKTLDVPGAKSTEAYGINNAGDVVGNYFDGTQQFGFLYDGTTYAPFNGPGGVGALPYGINNKGQIVGTGVYSPGNRGFLATPTASVAPEPSSVADMAVVALIAAGFVVKARRRRAAQKSS